MDPFDGIGKAAGALGLAGAAASLAGSRETARAYDDRAARLGELGEAEAEFLVRQADLEAELLMAEGLDEAGALAFNRRVALENAEWERRAGRVALEHSRKRWEDHIETTVARFAASGATLEGTTTDFVMEQIGEMEEDLFNIGLNAERAALREEAQADFFSLRHDQAAASARRRSEGRRSLGRLEAGTAAAAATGRAQAARTRSRAAETAGLANLFRSGSSLLSGIAEFDLFGG